MAAAEGMASHWWAFVGLGLVAGVLSGALGLGSGIVVIPALVLALALPQKSAQGMWLAAMVPMALVGAIRYKVNPQIDVDLLGAALLAAGAVIGALVGTELSAKLPAGVLRRLFACFIIAAALKMLLVPGRPPGAPRPAPAPAPAAAAEGAGQQENATGEDD